MPASRSAVPLKSIFNFHHDNIHPHWLWIPLSICLCVLSGSAWRVGKILGLLQVPAHWLGQVMWPQWTPSHNPVQLLLGGVQWKLRRCSLILSATKEDSCTSLLDNWPSLKKCHIRFGCLYFGTTTLSLICDPWFYKTTLGIEILMVYHHKHIENCGNIFPFAPHTLSCSL